MALLNNELSVWEIGFRWAGHDPDKINIRLPLPVRDNFRVLMDAILCMHLECFSLNGEKYRGTDPEEAKLYIRYWLDDVNACIEGVAYDKKLLKWARIERLEFKRWCERRNISLPEFWFPNGWALEYQWDEEALVSDPIDDDEGPNSGPSEPIRPNQRIAIACQQVAQNLWKRHPDMTIAAMVEHEVIRELCGAASYSTKAVRGWLSAVAPAEVRQRRGRPRKGNTPEDEG